ncbi:hypothetical protein GWI33_011513, partial [Rhynchophorus ferrugineus]
MFCPLRLPSS